MPIINQIVKGGGSPAPAHYIEFPVDVNGAVVRPSNILTLGNIQKIGASALLYLFYQNSFIRGNVDFSSVEIVDLQGLSYTFSSTQITGLNLSSVVYISTGGCDSIARNVSTITTADISSVKEIGESGMSSAFRNSTLISTLSFPALKSVQSDSFSNIINGVTNCTLHFPSNMQATVEAMTGYPNFGGTNTTVLFDLPATVILTGANSQAYERNPKYDTATALAWRKQDTGTVPNLVIDWTPFYTSGTTDPAVSDTIYSDAACTTSVTTISSIA